MKLLSSLFVSVVLCAGGGPGWLSFEMLPHVDYRPQDIIVSVPAKSGTTWTMNMVHQLRTGGDANFTDLYWEVPWLEFKEYPGQPAKELLSRWEHIPHYVRRAFKAHAYPPLLPFLPEPKYVVVVRNGFDALYSMIPFAESWNKDFLELWGATAFSPQVALGMWTSDNPYSGVNFVRYWWPHRHASNVFMVHYSDMKASLPAVLRKMAKFLEIEVPEDRWPHILEYTSFQWMQANSRKFEFPEVLKDIPNNPEGKRIKPINEGGLVRKGAVGEGTQVLLKEMVDALETRCRAVLTDTQYHWYMNGGELEPLSQAEKHEL